MPGSKDQGIVLDEKAQEQPKDKERARENNLPGAQDQGGKHGGQKDGPKPSPQPDQQDLDPHNLGPERKDNRPPK